MRTLEDVARRDMIADYEVVGRPPEPDLEGLVRLAATVCGVSTAVINIIDDRFQHQVAAVGFEPSVCAREDSMCAVVLHQRANVVVHDARVDDRFSQNPFVTGELGHVRFYASSPLITPEGMAIGTICVFDEETGSLRTEHVQALDLLAHQVIDVLELRRITREIGASNEQLASFAGQVGHDLRNPLMALTGFLELAVDSPEMENAPDAAKSLARAESAATRMATMLADLLDYARLGGGKPRRVEVALDGIVAEVLEDLDSVILQSGAIIEADAALPVVGDPTLLRALLQNLIANAVKFSHAAGVVPHILVVASAVPGGWRITVDDNGPGVPEERRDSVFELMDRGEVQAVPGLGIGLSTCRRIVQAHGGRIGIDDSPLGGARVWVALPDAIS